MSEICFMSATDIVSKIRDKELSCQEVMAAHLSQIEQINPEVNAVVTQIPPEQALAEARADDEAIAQGREVGLLHGLPMAHKDLVPTKDLRTTLGSPIFKDQKVFGETLNPYDTTKTCGGSSGGAAVALACGMIPIADGSDMGGSLRNPASFCNVVGFRTSPGRVPIWPAFAGWFPISVQGPMARTVRDVALMLSAIAGPDPRSPISIAEPGSLFQGPLDRNFKNVKLAWSSNLGDLPVDPRVIQVLAGQRRVFDDIGCIVEEGHPDFSGADEIFKVWRAWKFELNFGELLKKHRHLMKDTVIWNIEEGQKLTGPQIGRAEVVRTELYHRVRKFMETYEFLICPVTQVTAFDIKQPWVQEIDGVKMNTYIDWMKSCYFITVTGLPAISVPCGFTPQGLPVGIQIVGRHNDDLGVLQLAYAFEKETQVWKRRPALVES
jgi:amidase